ncbi:hypothetical protein [Amnibacterium endophyticum]|uniref:Uncharacterized protein n=1 Tax=Amnibacterium endophyticum TaxID=2109337 RepID=A0ABW4LF54_9MICO
MVAEVIGQAWVQDLPVCLPGRACVDQSPVAAPLMTVTSALTPLSPVLAVLGFAFVGVALVLMVVGVRRQWRGDGASGLLALLALALLLFGVIAWWVIRGRLALIKAIYSDLYGQAAALVPPSLVGSWPAVLASCWAMAALGGLAVVAMVGTALLRLRADATS